MRYDYREEMKADIIAYLQDNDLTINMRNFDDIYDKLMCEDSVTGNASGSYTFNRWKARDYVIENLGELADACNEFCIDDEEVGKNFLNEEWEWMDVTIRVYLLSSVLYDMID